MTDISSDAPTPPPRRAIPHGKDLVEYRLDCIDEAQTRVEAKIDRLLSSSTSHGERLASLDQRVNRAEADINRATWGAIGAALTALGSLVTIILTHGGR